MHQVIRTGGANSRQALRILAVGEGQYILSVFEAQDLAFLCRNQPAQDGRDLGRDGAPLLG